MLSAEVCIHFCSMPGDFPWSSGGSGSAIARAHFARRYRTAKALVERYEEEKVYLQVEIIRTLNWVEEQGAAVSNRLWALRAEPRHSLAVSGQIVLLERRQKQLNIMGADISRVRSAHGTL